MRLIDSWARRMRPAPEAAEPVAPAPRAAPVEAGPSDDEAALRAENARLIAALKRYEDLQTWNRLIEIDYPVEPRIRHGHGRPLAPLVEAKLQAQLQRAFDNLSRFEGLIDGLGDVPMSAASGQLQWDNNWLTGLDGIAIYGFLADRNPRTYLEIGSGFSTQFARKAIQDHGLRTRIVSIDPYPRAEIDQICDEVVRHRLEDADLSLFAQTSAEDVVFCDNSHRAFQNSDVTVFFTEVVPVLPPGVLIGVHDICLPADYPPDFVPRYYNEQYLLACWLLASDRIQVELPAYYVSSEPAPLAHLAAGLGRHPALAGRPLGGSGFWWTLRPS